jgi:sulfate-transporting ATPase
MNFIYDAILSLPIITVYLLYALGVVVIYRASRVLNLAHGAMAMVPAYFFYTLGQAHFPALIAAILAIAFGGLLGVGTERLVVRRLRAQGPTAQTVGTVAVFGLSVALVAKLYGTAPRITQTLFPEGVIPIGNTGLKYGQVMIFIIGVAVAGGLFALFRFTSIGLAMRGTADNRRGAMLMGVDVERTTMVAWGLGGMLAAMAGVFVGTLTNIHPFTLSLQVLPAFVAALLGGLESLPGAVWGAAVVGLVQGEIPALGTLPGISALTSSIGFPELALMVVTFVAMLLRGSKLVGSKIRSEMLSSDAPAGDGKRPAWVGKAAFGLALVLAVFPFLPFVGFALVSDVALASFYLIVALSIVLLTGWVGQISLAQAAFVGVGAFFTSVIANKLHVPFPINFVFAVALAAGIAGLLGVVALRVRGLYLAVATLVFAWMADSFLFKADWFGYVGGSADVHLGGIGDPRALPYFDLSEAKLIYFLFIAVAAGCLYGLANLRESKTGRAFFAVRGSEVAAASLGIDVTRYKLLAFLIAGGMAGAAGNLFIVFNRSVVPEAFSIIVSLFFLSVAVVGGLMSIGGAVAAAVLFAALEEVFRRVTQLAGFLDIVSSGLLLAVLLLYPGGLAAVPNGARALWLRVRDRERIASLRAVMAERFAWLGRARDQLARAASSSALAAAYRRVLAARVKGTSESLGDLTPARATVPSTNGHNAGAATSDWEKFAAPARPETDAPRPETVVLRAANITVRFGGLTAVDNASLELHEGEIVGLIGANGAGKTTMYNVISGLLLPVSGTVELLGHDVTQLAVHERSRIGMARTFQDIQLFPQLSVFENLLVATHVRNTSTLGQHVLVTPHALRAEAEMRGLARLVLEALGMKELASRRISDVPFGLLRMIEVARALVTGSQIILLDEPASGLDDRESDRLARLLLYVRQELGLSMLVVEHDVRTVVGLSDYMYVLDQGQLIGEGRPHEVQRSERVIEAYLGQATVVAQ